MKHYSLPRYNEPLISLRDRSGMTQVQLAKETGVSRSSWQKFEYGQRRPNKAVKARIAELMMKHPA